MAYRGSATYSPPVLLLLARKKIVGLHALPADIWVAITTTLVLAMEKMMVK